MKNCPTTIKAQVNDKITIIDMYTILPKVKKKHMTEFKNFALAAGLTDDQFKWQQVKPT